MLFYVENSVFNQKIFSKSDISTALIVAFYFKEKWKLMLILGHPKNILFGKIFLFEIDHLTQKWCACRTPVEAGIFGENPIFSGKTRKIRKSLVCCYKN